jgi:hypothetical protein
MMALGSLNAAVALPLPLPSALQAGLAASPAGPLLSSLGLRLDPGAPAGGEVVDGISLGALGR